MESVYLETTVIGHIAGRLHPAATVASRQQVTRYWWLNQASHFRIYISQLVLDECGEGDPIAVEESLKLVEGVDLLESSEEVDGLVEELIAAKAIPASEPRDAFHVAIAAVNGIEYLLTWNFKHIANASMRGRIEQVCRDAGFEPPIICTPEELLGGEDGT